MLSTDELCGQKSTLVFCDLAQPLDVYKGQEQPAPQGPHEVRSSAQRLLLPSLGLSWAGTQLSACPSSVLRDAVHPVAWSCLVDIFSLSWAWTVIAAGRGW